MPALRVSERIENGRTFVSREADIFRDLLSGARTRVVDGRAPATGAGLGGVFGQRPSLVKWPVVFVAKTVDNVIETTQRTASINRSQLR